MISYTEIPWASKRNMKGILQDCTGANFGIRQVSSKIVQRESKEEKKSRQPGGGGPFQT
jgi:hypothetical protein